MTLQATSPAPAQAAARAALPILTALSLSHCLNDLLQSLLPAIYPNLKQDLSLSFAEIGLITLVFQITASLLQPAVGAITDKRPQPYSLAVGMACSLVGLLLLSRAHAYGIVLIAAAIIGIGSSIFHPEATRMARNASGGQHGLAQGIFQVGGQTGGALGPLLAAFVIVPRGQGSLAWFSVAALVAMMLMVWTAASYARLDRVRPAKPAGAVKAAQRPGKGSVAFAITILIVLLFSKNAYTASFTSFYTFYLMGKFGVTIQHSQEMLFLFLASSAAGALGGGMLGDRIGRNKIIWFSILGALPFTLVLPYADLFWTGVLTIVINVIMSSAFAAILIYALELLPGRVGLVGGFFYGLSFGLGGLAAALLGEFADLLGIETVYKICSFIPLVGLLAWFLPRLSEGTRGAKLGH